MIWVIAVVVLCEIVIFAQLMLSFQKRAARLRVARSPILKRIEGHKTTLVELADKVKSNTANHLAKMEQGVEEFTLKAGHAANIVAELDNEAHERAEELGLSEDEEEEEEDSVLEDEDGDFNPMKVVKDKGFDPFDTVRNIRGDLEDLYEAIENLKHDEEIVSNMAKRLAATNAGGKD